MIFIIYAVVLIAAVAFALSAASKTGAQNVEEQEFEAPTSGEGKNQPVLFGTKYIKAPNVVWYGDITTSAVKKKGGKK